MNTPQPQGPRIHDKMMIRPAIEYGAAVYHSSLTDEQDEALEKLQTQALKAIYDPYLSGRKLREEAGISTLRERICLKFAAKCATSPRFIHLFPLKTTRTSARSTRAGPAEDPKNASNLLLK